MSKQITNLKVFIASPSDVTEERKILEHVINELNKLPGERLSIRLELVKWETDTYPSLGLDPQSVINEQIGDDYDIFIGVLWKRFGLPTGREESGTVEEFTRAYNRAYQNPNNIRVMFYFNDSPISPSELNLEQYNKINDFRKSIGEQGVYYWQYKKIEDFERFVRLHLGMVMQEFGITWGLNNEKLSGSNISKVEQKGKLIVEVELNSDTEEGFLDLIISSIGDFGLASESINRIGTLLSELSSKTEGSTEELNGLSQPINPNEARPIINRQADTYEDFAQRTAVELPILSTKFRSAIDSYTKSAQLLTDFKSKDTDQIKQAIDVMSSFKTSIVEAQNSTTYLKNAVQSIPRMTTRLNHAKKHLVDILENILEEYKAEESLATEAEKIFVDLLQKFNNSDNN